MGLPEHTTATLLLTPGSYGCKSVYFLLTAEVSFEVEFEVGVNLSKSKTNAALTCQGVSQKMSKELFLLLVKGSMHGWHCLGHVCLAAF